MNNNGVEFRTILEACAKGTEASDSVGGGVGGTPGQAGRGPRYRLYFSLLIQFYSKSDHGLIWKGGWRRY